MQFIIWGLFLDLELGFFILNYLDFCRVYQIDFIKGILASDFVVSSVVIDSLLSFIECCFIIFTSLFILNFRFKDCFFFVVWF